MLLYRLYNVNYLNSYMKLKRDPIFIQPKKQNKNKYTYSAFSNYSLNMCMLNTFINHAHFKHK